MTAQCAWPDGMNPDRAAPAAAHRLDYPEDSLVFQPWP
jgi:hypothetical protein